MEITGVLEPPKRSKQLTEKELKNLRTNIQKLNISSKQQISYSLVTKDSKSGFFSNERLLILNSRDKQLFYVSKLPEGLIPFLNLDEVRSLKFKIKVTREDILKAEVTNFKCYPLTGKISTFVIQYKRGGIEEKLMFIAGGSKAMSEWVQLINRVLLKDDPPPEKHSEPIEVPKPIQEKNIKLNETQPTPPPRLYRPLTESKKLLTDNTVTQPNIQNSDIKPIKPQQSYHPQNLTQSKIANMPYSDHVGELKYLRKQNPKLFNTTNELSRPKLQTVEQAENNFNKMNTGHTINPSFQKKQAEESKDYEVNSRYIDSRVDDYGRIENNPNIVESKVQSDYFSDPRNQVIPQYPKSIYQKQPSRKELKQQPEQIRKSKSGFNRPDQNEDYTADAEYQRYPRNNQEENEPQIKINQVGNNRTSNTGFNRPKQEYYGSKSLLKNEDSRKNIPREGSRKQLAGSKNSSDIEKIGLGNNTLNAKSSNFISVKSGGLSSKRSFNRKKWNEIFAETQSKLEVYEDFMHTSFNVVRQIINELPLDKNQKEYLPIEIKPPFFTYYDEGIIITLHYFQNSKNVPTSAYSSDAPLLYDQSTYQLLKRQFYNYNLVLSITANEGFIKVPLCAYFQYKGVIAMCKAQIPELFSEITPKRFQKQFEIIENQIHVRFMYGSFNSYLHPNNKYIIVDNMRELIPEIPFHSKQQSFFRRQFLLNYDHIIEDVQSSSEAHYYLTHNILPQFISKLQTLETYVVCTSDLMKICHQAGLSIAYLPLLIQQSKSFHLKKIFTSQLVSIIFVAIFRSEINHLFATFPIEQFDDLSLDAINRITLDSCHTLLELMFGYSNASETIWKIIVEQCSQKYRVPVSKEDIIPGYLLGAIIEKIGLVCDFRRSAFDKHNVQFFVKSGNIPKDLLVGFKMHIRRYDLSSISPLVRQIQQILYNEPSAQNFKTLITTLNLKHQSIPNYLQNLQPNILAYLCNFVPYSEHQEFQHLGIYNMIVMEPHTFYSIKLSLLAVKWCIKKKIPEEAHKIYEMKEIQNAFWLGQYNPAISEFYDFFSMYYASFGKFDEAIQLAKLSLKNIIKVLGVNELPVADKHYQLGNIFFKMGKKEQSLKEYSRTKDILMSHNQVHIGQYAVILLKLAVLYLNFGKITECINSSLQSLKIFDQTQSSQLDQIGTFQILSRCYEITKKNNELAKLGEITSEKFNYTENSQIFERMAKIVLFIRLKNMSSAESKAFLTIITKLQSQNSSISTIESFTYLHRKSQTQILMKKVINFLDNINYLYEQANKRDIFRRYNSLDYNTKTQAEQMLVIFDALGKLIGFGYMIGSLKDYQ